MTGFDRERVVEFLTAVGDPARLEVIFMLSKRGRLNVGQIASEFEISRPAISHHLKVLKTAGVVESQKAGQEVLYELKRESVASELRHLADLVHSQDPPPTLETPMKPSSTPTTEGTRTGKRLTFR